MKEAIVRKVENRFKNKVNRTSKELDRLLQLIADLDEELELFAIGGTAMVLKGIKEATKDIDFMVPNIKEYEYLIK